MIPGDPVRLMMGEHGGTAEQLSVMRAKLGLDKPLLEQYVLFVKKAVTGDLGTSITSQTPVWTEFKEHFPATFELSLLALFLAITFGIIFGVLSAVYRNKTIDYILTSVSLVGYSMPIFWWALVLILFFSVGLEWFPVSGRLSVVYDVDPKTGFMLIDSLLSEEEPIAAFLNALKHLFLPAFVLSTIPLATISRMTRASVLEVLREDYIKTARAKGLSSFKVYFSHALRNALMPVVTVIGLMVGTMLTGAILTETIFSWPGIGRWLVSAVESRDYPVVQGGLLLTSGLVIFVNWAVDLIYVLINPKLRS